MAENCHRCNVVEGAGCVWFTRMVRVCTFSGEKMPVLEWGWAMHMYGVLQCTGGARCATALKG